MEAITLEQARECLIGEAKRLEKEILPIEQCVFRILAEDMTAKISQPPFAHAVMDGYAVRSSDVREASKEHPAVLSVTENLFAGSAPQSEIKAGCAARIMTGAMMPDGADCVIKQEDTDYGEETVNIFSGGKTDMHVAAEGEDFQKGEILGRAGETIDSYFIATMAAMGQDQLPVTRRCRVAVIATGDELVNPRVKALPQGKRYDANTAFLHSRLIQLGCEVVWTEIAGDEMSALIRAMEKAVECRADVIITTGGVSVGVKDLLPKLIENMAGKVLFHGIQIKPGMPTMASVVKNTLVISLSGNPYSAYAVFELLMQPLLKEMSGRKAEVLLEKEAVMSQTFRKKSPCRRLLRGYYDGRAVDVSSKQKNTQILAGIGSNCLLDIPAESEELEQGDIVKILLL